MRRRSPRSTLTDTLFPVTTLCRSCLHPLQLALQAAAVRGGRGLLAGRVGILRRCRRRAAAAVRGALGFLGLARSFALGFRAHALAGAARAEALCPRGDGHRQGKRQGAREQRGSGNPWGEGCPWGRPRSEERRGGEGWVLRVSSWGLPSA